MKKLILGIAVMVMGALGDCTFGGRYSVPLEPLDL